MSWFDTDDESQPDPVESDEFNLVAATRRVWEGRASGRPDCWLLVPKDDSDLDDWLCSEASATEVVPLRVCRELCTDGSLVLSEADPCGDAISPEDEGW